MCVYIFLKEINYKFYKAKIWGRKISLKSLLKSNVKFGTVYLNFHDTPISSICKWSVSDQWSFDNFKEFFTQSSTSPVPFRVQMTKQSLRLREILKPCGLFRTMFIPKPPCLTDMKCYLCISSLLHQVCVCVCVQVYMHMRVCFDKWEILH